MNNQFEQITPDMGQPIPFKAETRQLLDILIHSLYTEREIFLRELISNASDALTRMSFEIQKNRDILDPNVELAITITIDPQAGGIRRSSGPYSGLIPAGFHRSRSRPSRQREQFCRPGSRRR